LKASRVRLHQFHIGPAILADSFASRRQHRISYVHTDDLSLCAHGLPKKRKVEARAATEFHNGVPGFEGESINGFLSICSFPEASQVVELSSKVVPLGSASIDINDLSLV